MTTDLPQKACVFCNGYLKNPAKAKKAANDCDLLIAADGGAKYFLDIGLTPHVITGDMDSIDLGIWANKTNIRFIQYQAEKDKSDTELAVEYALEQGCRQVILLAATGGRMDHTLGNVALLAAYPGRIAILDDNYTLVAVDKSEKCVLNGNIGTTVSLIPYGVGPLTIRTTGLRYPLPDQSLQYPTHGLSNEMSQTQACVCVKDGILLVSIENDGAFTSSTAAGKER